LGAPEIFFMKIVLLQNNSEIDKISLPRRGLINVWNNWLCW